MRLCLSHQMADLATLIRQGGDATAAPRAGRNGAGSGKKKRATARADA